MSLELSDKICFSEAEAAKYIGMSRSYLRKARIGIFKHHVTNPPTFIRVAERGIRYLKADLDIWLNSQPKGETIAEVSVKTLALVKSKNV